MILSEELKAVKEKGIAKSKWIEIVIEKAEELEKQIELMKCCQNCNDLLKECIINLHINTLKCLVHHIMYHLI